MIKPTGHDPPGTKDYKHSDELLEKCLAFLAKPSGDPYEHALALDLTDIAGLCSLALSPKIQKHAGRYYFGYLLSAAFNKSKETVLVYDFDVPVQNLGYKCEKIVVNRGIVGDYFGNASSGLVINLGTCGGAFGKDASGVILNAGEAKDHFANNATGIAINTGTVGFGRFQKNGTLICLAYMNNYWKDVKKVVRGRNIRYHHLERWLQGTFGAIFGPLFTLLDGDDARMTPYESFKESISVLADHVASRELRKYIYALQEKAKDPMQLRDCSPRHIKEALEEMVRRC